jgi:D-glycero-D-manno-heptose 1,7-bisphosphate phosphatase
MGRTGLLLDRDGVLNEPVWDPHVRAPESPLAPRDVRLCAGAASAISRAARAGLTVAVVSNQPAAAKGVVTVQDLHDVHDEVLALLAAQGAYIDGSFLCLHHKEGSVRALTVDCACRKPAPGLLIQAAADLGLDLSRSWLVGDTDADVGAAAAAGLAGVVVLDNPRTAHRRGSLSALSPLHSQDVESAVSIVLTRLRG